MISKNCPEMVLWLNPYPRPSNLRRLAVTFIVRAPIDSFFAYLKVIIECASAVN